MSLNAWACIRVSLLHHTLWGAVLLRGVPAMWCGPAPVCCPHSRTPTTLQVQACDSALLLVCVLWPPPPPHCHRPATHPPSSSEHENDELCSVCVCVCVCMLGRACLTGNVLSESPAAWEHHVARIIFLSCLAPSTSSSPQGPSLSTWVRSFFVSIPQCQGVCFFAAQHSPPPLPFIIHFLAKDHSGALYRWLMARYLRK